MTARLHPAPVRLAVMAPHVRGTWAVTRAIDGDGYRVTHAPSGLVVPGVDADTVESLARLVDTLARVSKSKTVRPCEAARASEAIRRWRAKL